MSLLEPENLNYLTTVEQAFCALRDSGLTLSASDYQVIAGWEARGIPVQAVCRAMEAGYVKYRKHSRVRNPKVSLSRLRDLIESELEQAAR